VIFEVQILAVDQESIKEMNTAPDASPAGDSGTPSYISDSDAAAQIEGLLGFPDDEEESPAQPPAAQSEEDNQSAEEAPEEPSEDEEGSQPDEESEPEADTEGVKSAKGSEWTTLRNGQRVRIADLKKTFDEAQELRAQQAKYQSEESQRAQYMQRIQQQAQHFEQGIQAAIAIMQENMPPAPDRSLLNTDPIEYITQKENYEAARNKLSGLVNQQQQARMQAQAQYQAQAAQQQAAQESTLKNFIAEQQSKLIEKMPELKQPEQAKKFYNDFLSTGQQYGFTQDELNKVYDHRLLSVMRDAMQWRSLQGKAPAVTAKAAKAAPIRAPGKQTSQAETNARDYNSKMDRLRKSGRDDDAASILMDLL